MTKQKSGLRTVRKTESVFSGVNKYGTSVYVPLTLTGEKTETWVTVRDPQGKNTLRIEMSKEGAEALRDQLNKEFPPPMGEVVSG